MSKLELTNADNTAKLEAKAQKALLEGIDRDWSAAEEAAKRIASRTIFAINKLRSCGMKLQQLCGHEQLSMDFFVRIKDRLPKTMHYTGARAAVHVANKLAQDVETIQEARAVQKDLFEGLLDCREPKRLVQQTSHERNFWNDFVASAASFAGLFDKLEDEPMENWGQEKLRKFVETTEPIAMKHHKAAELLSK